MTMQREDSYLIDGSRYERIFRGPRREFVPEDYGFEPKWAITSCGSGFWCCYTICENRLILHELYIHDANENYPPLNGVEPAPTEYIDAITCRKGVWFKNKIDRFHGHKAYKDVGLPLDFTGAVLIGRERVQGVPCRILWKVQPCGYRHVLKLDFENGELIRKTDLSPAAELQRQRLAKHSDEDARRILWNGNAILDGLPEQYKEELLCFYRKEPSMPISDEDEIEGETIPLMVEKNEKRVFPKSVV